jgi:xanthine dehydrogenase large subunit
MNKIDIDIRKEEITGGTHRDLRHDSAHKHVTGEADYIDDMVLPEGALHMAAGLSDRAHADILTIDLSEVEAMPGVVLVLTHKDIPGHNDIGQRHRPEPPRRRTVAR